MSCWRFLFKIFKELESSTNIGYNYYISPLVFIMEITNYLTIEQQPSPIDPMLSTLYHVVGKLTGLRVGLFRESRARILRQEAVSEKVNDFFAKHLKNLNLVSSIRALLDYNPGIPNYEGKTYIEMIQLEKQVRPLLDQFYPTDLEQVIELCVVQGGDRGLITRTSTKLATEEILERISLLVISGFSFFSTENIIPKRADKHTDYIVKRREKLMSTIEALQNLLPNDRFFNHSPLALSHTLRLFVDFQFITLRIGN